MLLYRGIAVSAATAEDILNDMRTRGLIAEQGRWSFSFHDLKPRLAELWKLPVVTLGHTRPNRETPQWVCACADEVGATYYAATHNATSKDNMPLLITFEADPDDMIVDGRDFLYRVFQTGNPERAGPLAERLFGRAIRRYLDGAWSTQDQDQRIAMCDLAIQDGAVISAHAQNKTVIGGRYGTRFCSAFLVRLPVPAERVLDVRPIDAANIPEPEITLENI